MMKLIMKIFIAALLAGILVQCVSAEESGYTYLTQWGSWGTADEQFRFPLGIAVDSTGHVYVADSENARIQKFDSDGNFITKWGSWETGHFSQPSGVAVDSTGNVYVTDEINDSVQKFDSSGNFITKWGSEGDGDGEFFWPRGIAVDTAGNVYVADTMNCRIQKFTSDGEFLYTWGSQGTGDHQFTYPWGVAVDTADNVYVADSGNYCIKKFDSNRAFITKWGSEGDGDGEFDLPSGIAVDTAGNVYVADRFNYRIQKFTSDGEFLTKWGSSGFGEGEFGTIERLAVDSAGNIYVTEDFWDTVGFARIQKFARLFPPVADAGSDQTVPAGTAVTLDGSNSSDPNENIILYEWSFSEGSSATGEVIVKGYTSPGAYSATLTVRDATGLSDSDTINITVTPEEPPLETPLEATEHLIEEIEALNLPQGTENKMVTKLVEVQRYLEHANAKLNAVSAELEEQEADDLVEKVQMIIDAITSGDFTGWK
jgi:DNA-binding beta-propeller fold protein YncE